MYRTKYLSKHRILHCCVRPAVENLKSYKWSGQKSFVTSLMGQTWIFPPVSQCNNIFRLYNISCQTFFICHVSILQAEPHQRWNFDLPASTSVDTLDSSYSPLVVLVSLRPFYLPSPSLINPLLKTLLKPKALHFLFSIHRAMTRRTWSLDRRK